MAREATTVYVCRSCGADSVRWVGQCPACQAWNTLEAFREAKNAGGKGGGRQDAWAGRVDRTPRILAHAGGVAMARWTTGQSEMDRALGGGAVPGSVVLIGGDPGIGKSTLMLQALAAMAAERRTLYLSGEESLDQIADRGHRLGLDLSRVTALGHTDLDVIAATLDATRPEVVVADSVQTLVDGSLPASAGSVTQVRQAATRLTRWAKTTGGVVFLIGHVTKDGSLAGPRVLEHLVDTVFSFEGDPTFNHRLLRALKNRYGSVGDLGVFAMGEGGLENISNPSALFLERERTLLPGSCVFAQQDGPRPLLMDIQALLDPTTAANPRRLALGVDGNRVAMLLAVLHRHANMEISRYDVFVNAVGGLRALEPGADLPIALAMMSSLFGRAVPLDVLAFGEIGLTGEVRAVPHMLSRLKEAARQGFTTAVVPAKGLERLDVPGLRLVPVRHLGEAVAILMPADHGAARGTTT